MPPVDIWARTAAEAPNPWFSWDYLTQNSESLREALEQHVALTLVSVAVATVIAVPLAIVANRISWLSGPILAVSGVLYTIPSLALFAFLGPTLGLNPSTVVIGLVLYALLAIVRNALTGLQQVPPEVRDAAKGMGFGSASMLWRIDLPLALPGIMTGLRIATVSTVALVTVGYIIGFGGFGNVILTGFNNNFYKAQIMAGTLGCVGLALIFDLMLIGAGRALMPWTRRGRAA
jgi:osmoprotectant transport system permease protein